MGSIAHLSLYRFCLFVFICLFVCLFASSNSAHILWTLLQGLWSDHLNGTNAAELGFQPCCATIASDFRARKINKIVGELSAPSLLRWQLLPFLNLFKQLKVSRRRKSSGGDKFTWEAAAEKKIHLGGREKGEGFTSWKKVPRQLTGFSIRRRSPDNSQLEEGPQQCIQHIEIIPYIFLISRKKRKKDTSQKRRKGYVVDVSWDGGERGGRDGKKDFPFSQFLKCFFL